MSSEIFQEERQGIRLAILLDLNLGDPEPSSYSPTTEFSAVRQNTISLGLCVLICQVDRIISKVTSSSEIVRSAIAIGRGKADPGALFFLVQKCAEFLPLEDKDEGIRSISLLFLCKDLSVCCLHSLSWAQHTAGSP